MGGPPRAASGRRAARVAAAWARVPEAVSWGVVALRARLASPAARLRRPVSARVCMFLAHPLRHDTRVEKEAAALVDAGYEVRIVATAFPGLPRREDRAGVTVRARGRRPAAGAPRALACSGARGGGAPGTVLTRESAERSDLRARLVRGALRVHLRMVWRRYMRGALRAARDGRPASGSRTTSRRCRWRCGRGSGSAAAVLYDSHELFTDSSLARWEGRALGADRAPHDRPGRRGHRRSAARSRRSWPGATGSPSREVILNAPDAPGRRRRRAGRPAARAGPARGVADRPLPRRDRPAPRPGAADRGRRRSGPTSPLVMLGPSTDAYRGELEALVAERRRRRARRLPAAGRAARDPPPRGRRRRRPRHDPGRPVPQLPLRAAEQALRLPRTPACRSSSATSPTCGALVERERRRRHLRSGEPGLGRRGHRSRHRRSARCARTRSPPPSATRGRSSATSCSPSCGGWSRPHEQPADRPARRDVPAVLRRLGQRVLLPGRGAGGARPRRRGVHRRPIRACRATRPAWSRIATAPACDSATPRSSRSWR